MPSVPPQTGEPRDAVLLEVVYPHPIERVWRALTDPAAITRWLMENDFRPVLGYRFTLREVPPSGQWRGYVECEVVEVDPPRRLAYSWDGGGMPPTLVTFTLEAVPTGTRLLLEHTGFAAGGEWGVTVRDVLAGGWDTKLLRELLPALLDRMAAEEAEAIGKET
jgi:uncharacterized protein YndB with AHSA1/START domain